MCLCFPTAAGSNQGWQRCDFCHRPLPLPRKQSTGSPGAIPSLGGQGRLGQHCLCRDQISLTCRSGRSISPSTGGSDPAGTPMLPHTSDHFIPSQQRKARSLPPPAKFGRGKKKGHRRFSLVVPEAHLRLHR